MCDPLSGTPMSTCAKLIVSTALVAAALLGGGVSPAAAATPCWKTLLTDWYDGRIDGTYPIHCYTDTLKHLPADVQTYSSAHDDILRALQSAEAKLRKTGHKATPLTPIPPPKSSGSETTTTTTTTTSTSTTPGSGGGGGSSSGGGGGGTTDSSPGGTDAGGGSTGHQPAKGLAGVADKLNPSNPSSLPVPLLVLGGLAILLVAAGGVGLVAKRVQGRGPDA